MMGKCRGSGMAENIFGASKAEMLSERDKDDKFESQSHDCNVYYVPKSSNLNKNLLHYGAISSKSRVQQSKLHDV